MQIPEDPIEKIRENRGGFDPYIFNGGTTVAISGKDYSVIAADTRLSNGYYSIQTRFSTKLCKLTKNCVLSTVGCMSDCATLHKDLKWEISWYKYQHVFCTLAGVNELGEGVVYGFDAIGSKGKEESVSDGTGQKLIQPLLDSQVEYKNQLLIPKRIKESGLDMKDAVSLVKDAFQSAGERDIYTGDFCELFIIKKEGLKYEKLALKKD